jgi:hypothetical protein
MPLPNHTWLTTLKITWQQQVKSYAGDVAVELRLFNKRQIKLSIEKDQYSSLPSGIIDDIYPFFLAGVSSISVSIPPERRGWSLIWPQDPNWREAITINDQHGAWPTMPLLTAELVPQSCWYSNVRDHVSREQWDQLRRAQYKASNYRCEICGKSGMLHCHEVWNYDENDFVQRLARMIALCPECHEVKHIGLAGVKGREAIATEHLRIINCWIEPLVVKTTRFTFHQEQYPPQ